VVVVDEVVVVYGCAAGLDEKFGLLFDMKLVDGTLFMYADRLGICCATDDDDDDDDDAEAAGL